MGRKYLISFVLLAIVLPVFAAPLRVVSYNVENLFHPSRDTVAGVEKDDGEWTPEGEKRWSFTRYKQKIDNIARVLTNIGEWDGVDIAGLQEVENAECMKRLCHTLRRGEYDYVHYESPDRRGIDVALLYKKARIDTIRTRAIPINGGMSASLNGELLTRDILYVCAEVDKKDTLHLFVCHLPSQRDGATESEWKRKAAKKVLQKAVDSVLTVSPDAKMIVMGDMNSEPQKDISSLRNRMIEDRQSPTGRQASKKGTHKHNGQWACLDQFYTSPALDSISTVRIYDAEWIQEPDEQYMGLRPKRTYKGYVYQNGYSDHLPIILECRR